MHFICDKGTSTHSHPKGTSNSYLFFQSTLFFSNFRRFFIIIAFALNLRTIFSLICCLIWSGYFGFNFAARASKNEQGKGND